MIAVLSHGRVTLRPLSDDDLDRLADALTRPGVREWWAPIEELDRRRADLSNDGCAFAIDVDGALAGWLGFDEETEPDYRHAGMDIFLLPEHHGGGIGRTALRLAGRWLIDERGHHRLTIDPACHNERAIRAYSAVGFRPVGVMRSYERGWDGRWHDNLLMDLLGPELTAPE